jgi:hypothetical protein
MRLREAQAQYARYTHNMTAQVAAGPPVLFEMPRYN